MKEAGIADMSAETIDLAMIPSRQAAGIAAISRQRLRYWEDTKLIEPTVSRKLSTRNVVRLYSLDRLLEAPLWQQHSFARLASACSICVRSLRTCVRKVATQRP